MHSFLLHALSSLLIGLLLGGCQSTQDPTTGTTTVTATFDTRY